MKKQAAHLYTLGGVAGICVGIFVLTFAIMATVLNIGFVPETYSGASIDYWVQSIQHHPMLSMLSVISLMIGFTGMFVGGFCLFNLISGPYWQKYLAISGYTLGIPVAIYNFLERLSLQYQIIVLSDKKPQLLNEIELQARISLQEWQFTGEYVGPFLVVMIGTSFMAWAAQKEGLLPNWLCYWAYSCGFITLLYFFKLAIPALEIAALGAGPLHMLWFLIMGITLLKKR